MPVKEGVSNLTSGQLVNIAYLNQVLAFRLGDKWLQFGGGKGIDEASLRHDQ